MRIALTGATGFIGRELARRLIAAGHDLIILARDPERARRALALPCDARRWDAATSEASVTAEALEGAHAIVHLAGDPVAGGRWTESRKRSIRESRAHGTRMLVEAVAMLERRQRAPGIFISASAIGYYGNRGDEELVESSPPGDGFLAEVCRAWETPLADLPRSARPVTLRIGVVLGSDAGGPEGALAPLVPLYRACLGGPIGGGKQWQSWIALEDLLRVIELALQNESLRGPVNAVTGSVRQREFALALGHALHRPAVVPTPAFAVRVAMGEMACIALDSQRVIPTRLRQAGFEPRYRGLPEALEAALGAGPEVTTSYSNSNKSK